MYLTEQNSEGRLLQWVIQLIVLVFVVCDLVGLPVNFAQPQPKSDAKQIIVGNESCLLPCFTRSE